MPTRKGNASLALRLNQSSRWFPPPALWLAVGLVALWVRRPAAALALATPAIAAFIVIVLSALAIAAVPHYSVPVAPAFLLLGAGALLGARRADSV
jgi:CHASE2 domain-containing sensor protein